MRPLLEQFRPKVYAIEESKGLDIMKVFRGTTQGENETVNKDMNSISIKYYEFSSQEQVRAECTNLNKSKGKAFNTTKSDEYNQGDLEGTLEERVN